MTSRIFLAGTIVESPAYFTTNQTSQCRVLVQVRVITSIHPVVSRHTGIFLLDLSDENALLAKKLTSDTMVYAEGSIDHNARGVKTGCFIRISCDSFATWIPSAKIA